MQTFRRGAIAHIAPCMIYRLSSWADVGIGPYANQKTAHTSVGVDDGFRPRKMKIIIELR